MGKFDDGFRRRLANRNNRQPWMFLVNLANQQKAIFAAQIEIHEHNREAQILGQFHGFLRIMREKYPASAIQHLACAL